jgi:hypothetical protein
MGTALHHAMALSFVSREQPEPKELQGATAALLWIDRPFVVTSSKILDAFRTRLAADPSGQVLLGSLPVGDLERRLLGHSGPAGLASLRIEPDELSRIGDTVSFYSPLRWPPQTARVGERIRIAGFPQDQWPAAVEYSFRVEKVCEHRFHATLEHASMPGRLTGLCGAPAFRIGSPPEFVGVVVESMFHNEVLRVQHARSFDACGHFPALAPAH